MMKIMTMMFMMFFVTCGYAEMIRGKQLFDKAQCMACHNSEDFKDKTISKSKTFEQMKEKVSACQINNDAQWFDDDEHDVAMYLNKEYYHFKQKE
ncbi:MAG: c-type cytochrome [Sulfuricurvum sp.]|nr:c-type cytochrome [Sulfuricurvum sp.]MDP3023134.1 c-type cytochrome [Sulfuricurvum sp.]MDP3120435.1 c-type cytochrome [Sulfuricurvum sp.]